MGYPSFIINQSIFELQYLKSEQWFLYPYIKHCTILILFFSQGYVGLLLGVAIFHLADLVNIFLDRRILGYQKMLENEEKDLEEEASELYQVIKNEDSITSS